MFALNLGEENIKFNGLTSFLSIIWGQFKHIGPTSNQCVTNTYCITGQFGPSKTRGLCTRIDLMLCNVMLSMLGQNNIYSLSCASQQTIVQRRPNVVVGPTLYKCVVFTVLDHNNCILVCSPRWQTFFTVI